MSFALRHRTLFQRGHNYLHDRFTAEPPPQGSGITSGNYSYVCPFTDEEYKAYVVPHSKKDCSLRRH